MAALLLRVLLAHLRGLLLLPSSLPQQSIIAFMSMVALSQLLLPHPTPSLPLRFLLGPQPAQ